MKVTYLKRIKKLDEIKKAHPQYPNDHLITIIGPWDPEEVERIKKERTARSGVTKFFVVNLPKVRNRENYPQNNISVSNAPNALPDKTK